MAANITEITVRKPVDDMTDAEVIRETLTLLRSLDATLAKLQGAWSAGGVRGLRRAAAAGHFERRQSDGSWAQITDQEAIDGGWGKT